MGILIPKEVQERIDKQDFKGLCSLTGGHLKNFPYHHITRENLINKSYRRPLSIGILSWVGTSAIGAEHYYPKIELGRIPFLGSYDGKLSFINCWDDPEEYKSILIETKFKYREPFEFEDTFEYTYEEINAKGFFQEERAYEWLLFMLKKYFPKTKYDWNDYDLENAKPF